MSRPDPHFVTARRSYTWLSRRLVLFALLCAVLPLCLLGWGLQIQSGSRARERSIDEIKSRLDGHRKSIELFLRERKARLRLLAATHSREHLADPGNLRRAFAAFNEDAWTISDLGVIDENGDHLAYEGPYDLLDRNYRDAPWFQEVLTRGVYVSDMFLGYRREPHFVIAVTTTKEGRPWILRATIDTAHFRTLVENVAIGHTGEVFLLSRDGVYQTSPRFEDEILEHADLEIPPPGQDIAVREVPASDGAPARLLGHVWLDEPPWLLVIRQDSDEAFREIRHARRATLLLVIVTAALVFFASVIIVHRVLSMVRRRDRRAEEMDAQLMIAGKLAALGELSAGVAHEINNPLAIILTERQILLDLLDRSASPEDLKEQLHLSLEQIDVEVRRCRRITHQLLRFARRTQSVLEEFDVNELIREVRDLLGREAKTSSVDLKLDLEEDLPLVCTDPSQLQQVILNLVNNAIDAHESRPQGIVRIGTRSDPESGSILLTCADTGAGIAPEHLDRIFEPFFTTKPVGKGTGLGLAISYAIVGHLGAELTVESKLGEGTTFELRLPLEPPAELESELKDKEVHP